MRGSDHTLDLVEDGAHHLSLGAVGALEALKIALSAYPPDAAGTRISGNPVLSALLAADGPIGRLVSVHMEGTPHPVRAVFFNKSAASNWSLGWHQDRVIAVRSRVEIAGFGPWSIKQGLHHVSPPFAYLRDMRTIRIHLDSVDKDNAPLLIAHGSHRERVGEDAIADVVRRSECSACLAERGDIWMYATPILHASERARIPAQRRVLQVDYSSRALPAPLEWLGI